MVLAPDEQTNTFMFLSGTIIAVTVFWRRPYASRICSIFTLCLESNALEKSTNNCVVSRFYCLYSDYLVDSQNLRSWGSISLKTMLIFKKIFLDFRLDRDEKYGI